MAHIDVAPTAQWSRAPERGVPVSAVAELKEIVQDLIEYRFLLYQLARRDIRIRYKQAAMGFFWAIFMPALVIVAGLVVKFAMAYFSGNDLQRIEIASLAVKAIAWAFFVGAIGFGTASLLTNIVLVTKVYFPREVLPVASTLAQVFDSSVGATVMIFILPFLGVSYGWSILWVPVLVVSLFAFTVGLCLFLSAANLFFRDVKYLVQVLLMFGIFFTPVFFEPSMFGPEGARLLMLNPLSPFLEGLRLSIVEGHNLLEIWTTVDSKGSVVVGWTPWYLLYGVVSSVALLFGSALFFKRREPLFAEYA